jgi:hypothetical protein
VSELAAPPPRAVTFRAVALGLFGTVVICAATPWNDAALNNTFLVGNNLPIGAVMVFFLFALLVNGPLSRWAPSHAFSSAEMAVAFSMTLVSCAVPASGLMRYLPPALVMPFWHARANNEALAILQNMDLPGWLFPAFQGATPAQWTSDPIVSGFVQRWPADSPYPFGAWLTPALTWGVFTFALYGALICMVCILRRQWIENERLPFPLAQIQVALVTSPRPGFFLNDIFRRRSFWIAFSGVFAIHSLNALSNYFPDIVPSIATRYSLWEYFTERPLVYLDNKIKDSTVYFTVIGVTYFLSSSVAFSLWFFYILDQVRRLHLGMMTGDPLPHGRADEHFGGLIALALIILWVGRHHFRMVLGQAFRGARPGEPQGRYLGYRTAFWGLVGCAAFMVGWLVAAGAAVLGAAVAVTILLMGFLIITRIIAEVGLVHGQITAPLAKPWTLLAYYGQPHVVSDKTFYLTSVVNATHYDFREVVPVYAMHGQKVADQTVFVAGPDGRAERRMGRRIIACLFVALLVGYVVSFYSKLWTQYTYAWTQDARATVLDEWGVYNNPRDQIVGPTVAYHRGLYASAHDPLAHMAGGFGITGGLAVLRLRYTWWPLHPIGFVMVGSFPGAHLWFSLFWGWLAKVLIVRFGGASMYTNAKPLFLGLIVGESLAAGFWLAMGIVLNALDLPYKPVNIMPQ